MAKPIQAVYEDGVFRPDEPPGLPDGTRVSIVVVTTEVGSAGRDTGEQDRRRRSPLEMIEEIASLPLPSDRRRFSGRDHDRILYGEREAQ